MTGCQRKRIGLCALWLALTAGAAIEAAASEPPKPPAGQPAGAATPVDPAPPLGGSHDAGYVPLEHRGDVWYGSTYWQGDEQWLRVGRDWHHPGDRAPSVRRFTAPRDGTIAISGNVFKAHRDGDGVRVSIRHNHKTVWQQSLAGDDGQGVDPNVTLEVRAGDAVRFVVEKGGHIFCDTTHWDPVVAYAGGPRFQASQGFSETAQGEGGWSYEMPGENAEAAAKSAEAESTRIVERWLSDSGETPTAAAIRGRLQAAGIAELELWTMIWMDWRRQDGTDPAKPETYSAAIAAHLAKTRTLLDDLRAGRGREFLAAESQDLERLAAAASGGADPELLYLKVRLLNRRIALVNPLMQSGQLLFCKRVPTSYSHLVMQYYGWRARAGGGLFVLESPGRSLACREITGGKLDAGCVLEPRLSYDARRVVFSYVACKGKTYDPAEVTNTSAAGYYHVWEANVDGSGLRQLTDGPFDDLMPVYLPDGGIAFSSTRRRGYARCFGPQFSARWDIYTLHRMDGDGKDLRMLSCHDTNEWFPEVANDGRILYARWDYIDRDAVTHQNLWAMRPDGSGPATVWGNATASPHCSFQAKSIPGSDKFVFTASAHHSITGGSIAIVDPSVDYDGHRAITRLTPEVPFPEAESRDIREYYASPWPLSEKYFLVAYSPTPLVWEPGANAPGALGIYLLDRFGNRELIYRDPKIGCTNPTPLVPRPAPPVIPSGLAADPPPTGEMVLADVYRGLGEVPRGSIRQLRIVQVFPKTTPLADRPPIGLAGEENGRAILGAVPVEPDGSAHFTVPALKPLLFQALDEDGLAYQTMRTVTYVQPGERITCVGCHENRMTAPTPANPTAARRAPSPIEPGPLGGRPFSYVEMVQPVWDAHCVRCHAPGKENSGGIDLTGTPARGFSQSYWTLCEGDTFRGGGTNPQHAAAALVPRFGARNQVQLTPPGGMYGARGSRLVKLLRGGHENVALGPGELLRIAAWIDCNAIFYGVNLPEDQARQLAGEAVAMPEIQ